MPQTISKYRVLEAMAERAGVHMRSYSPGDGVTRYRFFALDTPEVARDYFASSGLGTVLGFKAAFVWIEAFRAGTEAPR